MREPIDSSIALNVKNNTTLPQRVNILGGTQDPLGVPPHIIYEFDLSGETYVGNVNVSIVISNTSNPIPVTYTVKVNGDNIQAVAIALNTLNQGFFQTSGNTLYVSNDYYIYGALSLNVAFVSLWNTSNTSVGSSASNQIQLPLNSGGIYNFIVDWGDGSQDTITNPFQPEALHTYAVAGIYTLEITGIIDEWSFSFAVLNDNKKILNISNWGNLRFGIVDVYNFLGCSNLTLTSVIGVLDLSSTIYFDNTFGNCTSITTINGINTWNTSNVTVTAGMFNGCTNFNSNISNWNVSSVVNMVSMFQNAIAFNQNISTWDISNVASFTNFMTGKSASNYSSANLDAIYNTWSTLTVQPNCTVDFGTIKYTASGQAGKNILTGAPYNWIITDGGI
jgi:surface protein